MRELQTRWLPDGMRDLEIKVLSEWIVLNVVLKGDCSKIKRSRLTHLNTAATAEAERRTHVALVSCVIMRDKCDIGCSFFLTAIQVRAWETYFEEDENGEDKCDESHKTKILL